MKEEDFLRNYIVPQSTIPYAVTSEWGQGTWLIFRNALRAANAFYELNYHDKSITIIHA